MISLLFYQVNGLKKYRLLFIVVVLSLLLRIMAPLQAATTNGSLIKDLNSPDWDVRYQAALQLGEKRNKKAVRPLIKALSDRERIVRDSAALALSQLGGEEVEYQFLKSLARGGAESRSRAALALGRMRVKSAEEPLLKLVSDGNWLVRWSAVIALGMVGGEKSVPYLEGALQDKYYNAASGKYPVREAARKALSGIKNTGGNKVNVIDTLKSEIKNNPKDAEKVLILAEIYLGKKEERKAIRLLEKTDKLYPFSRKYKARVLFALAYGYGQLGRFKKSRILFSNLLTEYPNFQDTDKALYALGLLYYRLKDEDKAVEVWSRLINGHPKSQLVSNAREMLAEVQQKN